MPGPGLHGLKGLLEVVHRPAAAGAGDILRTVEFPPACLQKLIGEISREFRIQFRERDRIDLPVQQRFPVVAGGLEDDPLALCHSERSEGISPSAGIALRKVPRHRQFILRILGQGHPDRIADALGKEGGDGDARLDASGIPVAGLGNAHMEREDDPALLHHPGQFPVGLDHHDRIAGFEGHDYLVELRFEAHVDPFHGGKGHRPRRISVALNDIRSQRPVIQADADGRPAALAFFQEAGELAPRLPVVLVEVARVDPDFFHDGSDSDGRFRGKVDVGHQRDVAAGGPQAVLDFPHVRDILQARNSDPDELRTGCRETQALGHRRFDIIGMGIAHRLDDDGVVSADEDVTDLDDTGFHHYCCCCCCSSLSSATICRAILRSFARVCPRRGVSW